MKKTIKQIWEDNGKTFPFAVRKITWAKDTYVVIIKFGPYFSKKDLKDPEGQLLKLTTQNSPIGIPLSNDRVNLVLNNNDLFQRYSIIPGHDNSYWGIVNDIDLSRFIKPSIYSLDSIMHFGEYLGKEIRDVLNIKRKRS